MFYGLATNKVRVPGYKFTHTLCDIETLNRRAQHEAFYDVTAISFHAYPYVQDNYTLMGCGGSVGEGYGPMIVSSRQLTPDDLKQDSHRGPRHPDHGLSGAEGFQPRHRDRSRSLRPDHSRDSGRQIRSRTDHSRRPAHLLRQRTVQGDRPGRVVARDHRPGAAAGRQRHPPLARRGGAQDHLQGAARQHPARARSPRTGAGVRHAVCPRSRHARWPTASSACM